MKKVYLIGVTPPPFGGVTIKCKMFESFLKNNDYYVETINAFDVSKNILKLIKSASNCLRAFISNEKIVYCLDTKRLSFMLRIQKLFPRSLKNTTILAVGGLFHNKVEDIPILRKVLPCIKGIWVETEGMKQQMNDLGFSNVVVFPNPKSELGCCKPVENEKGKLRLVFFSQISKEKGILDIIKSIELLESNGNVEFYLDFYGHVMPEISKTFEAFIAEHENVNYCGVFDATKQSVYQQLNQYDVLLFPTYWDTEGVPGILVEAKMAGLAIIASARSHNSELVEEENNEGILLHDNYSFEMANAIETLYNDRKYLTKIKNSSYASRLRFSLEKYDSLINKI